MDIFSRLKKFSSKKADNNKGVLEAQLREKLTGILYDDELVEELLPAFISLSGNENFPTVMELLESKEKQIESITGGDWFKQDNLEPDVNITKEHQEEEDANMVDNYLSKKYGE